MKRTGIARIPRIGEGGSCFDPEVGRFPIPKSAILVIHLSGWELDLIGSGHQDMKYLDSGSELARKHGATDLHMAPGHPWMEPESSVD